MPEANSGTLGGNTNVNYPTGFTNNNCAIVSLMSHNTLHTDWWSTTGPSDKSTSMTSGNGDLMARLTSESIVVSASKIDTSVSRSDVTFKIILMKLPEI